MVAAAQTKAGNVIVAQRFVVARYGAPAWDRVLARLDAHEPEQIATLIAVEWVPLSLYHHVVVAMDEAIAGADRPAFMDAFGRFAAEHDLRTLHRALLRMVGPSFSMGQFASLWPRYHDTGRWRFEEEAGRREFFGQLTGWGVRDERTCAVVAGYIARLLELASGRKGASVVHTACLGRGDSTCTFHGRWG